MNFLNKLLTPRWYIEQIEELEEKSFLLGAQLRKVREERDTIMDERDSLRYELYRLRSKPADLEITQEYWDKLAEHIYYNHIVCLGRPKGSLSEENETCQHAYKSVALSVLHFLKDNPPDLSEDGNWLRLAIQHNGDAFLERLEDADDLPDAEELAKLYRDTLHKGESIWCPWGYLCEASQNSRIQTMQYILDHLRPWLRQPVDPDLWKGCFRLGDLIIRESEIRDGIAFIGFLQWGVRLTPADAARAAEWLASFAAAHGHNTEEGRDNG